MCKIENGFPLSREGRLGFSNCDPVSLGGEISISQVKPKPVDVGLPRVGLIPTVRPAGIK
jgi:hypothetical protein